MNNQAVAPVLNNQFYLLVKSITVAALIILGTFISPYVSSVNIAKVFQGNEVNSTITIRYESEWLGPIEHSGVIQDSQIIKTNWSTTYSFNDIIVVVDLKDGNFIYEKGVQIQLINIGDHLLVDMEVSKNMNIANWLSLILDYPIPKDGQLQLKSKEKIIILEDGQYKIFKKVEGLTIKLGNNLEILSEDVDYNTGKMVFDAVGNGDLESKINEIAVVSYDFYDKYNIEPNRWYTSLGFKKVFLSYFGFSNRYSYDLVLKEKFNYVSSSYQDNQVPVNDVYLFYGTWIPNDLKGLVNEIIYEEYKFKDVPLFYTLKSNSSIGIVLMPPIDYKNLVVDYTNLMVFETFNILGIGYIIDYHSMIGNPEVITKRIEDEIIDIYKLKYNIKLGFNSINIYMRYGSSYYENIESLFKDQVKLSEKNLDNAKKIAKSSLEYQYPSLCKDLWSYLSYLHLNNSIQFFKENSGIQIQSNFNVNEVKKIEYHIKGYHKKPLEEFFHSSLSVLQNVVHELEDQEIKLKRDIDTILVLEESILNSTKLNDTLNQEIPEQLRSLWETYDDYKLVVENFIPDLITKLDKLNNKSSENINKIKEEFLINKKNEMTQRSKKIKEDISSLEEAQVEEKNLIKKIEILSNDTVLNSIGSISFTNEIPIQYGTLKKQQSNEYYYIKDNINLFDYSFIPETIFQKKPNEITGIIRVFVPIDNINQNYKDLLEISGVNYKIISQSEKICEVELTFKAKSGVLPNVNFKVPVPGLKYYSSEIKSLHNRISVINQKVNSLEMKIKEQEKMNSLLKGEIVNLSKELHELYLKANEELPEIKASIIEKYNSIIPNLEYRIKALELQQINNLQSYADLSKSLSLLRIEIEKREKIIRLSKIYLSLEEVTIQQLKGMIRSFKIISKVIDLKITQDQSYLIQLPSRTYSIFGYKLDEKENK